jgi:hypothetical protein
MLEYLKMVNLQAWIWETITQEASFSGRVILKPTMLKLCTLTKFFMVKYKLHLKDLTMRSIPIFQQMTQSSINIQMTMKFILS